MADLKADRYSKVSWILAGVLAIVAIGSPLLGTKSFLGGDVVVRSAPWNQQWSGSETFIPIGDTIDNLGPARHQVAQRLRQGDIPAWDPLPAGGTELASVPSFSVASPFNLPYLVLPSRIAPAFTKLLELIAVLVGSVLFLRRLGASTTAGLFAGVAFAFSGFQVVWTNWPHTQTAALAPLLFWASERAVQERRVQTLIPIALATAAMLAAGFPAVAAHIIYALVFYLVIRGVAGLLSKDITPGELAKAGALVGAGLVLGIGLMGAQLGPFVDQVDERDLSYREGYGTNPLPSKLLVTAAIPHAYGSPNQGRYYGPINPMEALAFVGTSTLFLAGLGVVLWRRRRYPAGAGLALAMLSVLLTLALFFGGPTLRAFNDYLPTISTNAIGRMRGVWGFVIAMAAGLGLQALLDSAVRREQPADQPRWADRSLWAVPLYALAALAVAVRVGLRLSSTGVAEGEGRYVRLGVAVALIALTAIVGLWFMRHKIGDRLGPLALLVIGFEVLFFVIPFWPRIDMDLTIPETPTHAFLQDNIDDGRIVNDGLTLYTGTTGYFGLRTVTGHIFHDDTWSEMLVAVDPGAFNASRTFSFINLSVPGHLESPVLDRLRASHAVVTLDARVFGTYEEDDWSADDTVVVSDTIVASHRTEAQPVRGVVIFTSESVEFGKESVAGFHIRISSGGQTIESKRRLLMPIPPGGLQIAIAGEELPTSGSMTIEVSTYGLSKPVSMIANSAGEVGVGLVTPSDDGLKLVFAGGSAVYERLNALERFHWASESVVIADPARRVERLSEPLDPNVVVLSAPPSPGHAPAGSAGSIVSVDESDPDVLKVEVDAGGAGWLVVGDALQGGWVATVDGESTPLVEADHAVVAVELPSGRHSVELRFAPENGSEGLLATTLSIIALVLLAIGWTRITRAYERTGRTVVPSGAPKLPAHTRDVQ